MKALDELKKAYQELQSAKEEALAHNFIIANTEVEIADAKKFSALKKQAEAHYEETMDAFREALDTLSEDEQQPRAAEAMKYVSY